MRSFSKTMALSCLAAAAVLVAGAASAADCPGFRTGMMRVSHFGTGEDFALWIDAKAMTATADDLTYTITKNAACDYSIGDGVSAPVRMLVWSTGVAVFPRGNFVTPGGISLGVPERQPETAAVAAADLQTH